MSGIFDLARSFEQKSTERALTTQKVVNSEFQKHEESLREALKSNEQSLRKDILDSQKRLRSTALNSWKWIFITLTLLGLSVAATVGVTGWMIGNNITKIQAQNVTLSQLETHGVQLVEQVGQDGKKSLFLILPKGRTLGAPFQFEGKQTVQIEGK